MNLPSTIRGLALLLVFAATVAAFSSPAKAQEPAPVPFLEGQLSAVPQVMLANVPLDLAPPSHLAFRTLANFNHSTAQLARFFGLPDIALYFEGRASVFDTAADLAGEPRNTPL